MPVSRIGISPATEMGDAAALSRVARDVPDMVECIRAVADGFGGVSLEDVADVGYLQLVTWRGM